MSDRAEALARRFERAHREFIDVVEPLPTDQWLAYCPDDQCTVAALAHHVAIAYPFLVRIFTAIAAGEPTEVLTWAWLAASNAEDAKTFATCDRDETVQLLNQNADDAAAFIRSLGTDQLARTGLYNEGVPALTVDQWIRHVLIGHITTHLAGIRSALGLEADIA
jgi:hypothetical protein